MQQTHRASRRKMNNLAIIQQSTKYRIQEYEADTFIDKKQLLIPYENMSYIVKYEIHHIGFPLSVYYPKDKVKYIILYLHGNSSSCYEGYQQLSKLPCGVGLASFDFQGCGSRNGTNYITLGKNQSKDVDKAVLYLKQLGYPVVGWGRSMGSVSLLLSKQCDIIIADSPFSSLNLLCREISVSSMPKMCCCFVHMFFPCLFSFVRRKVKDITNLDPNELEIAELVKDIQPNKSVLIMVGSKDVMIHYSHTQKIYQNLKCINKRKIVFDGSHNSIRKSQILDQCYAFIQEALTKYQYQSNSQNAPIQVTEIQQIPLKRPKIANQYRFNRTPQISKPVYQPQDKTSQLQSPLNINSSLQQNKNIQKKPKDMVIQLPNISENKIKLKSGTKQNNIVNQQGQSQQYLQIQNYDTSKNSQAKLLNGTHGQQNNQ